MMVTDQDIDTMTSAYRRRLVAKALRDHLPGTTAHGLVSLAAAALQALDEDANAREISGELLEAVAAQPDVDQQIRLEALKVAIAHRGVADGEFDVIKAATRYAEYVAGPGR